MSFPDATVITLDYENLQKTWLEYWQKYGEVITLSSWLVKYNDYVIKDQNNFEQKKDNENNDNINVKFSNQADEKLNEEAEKEGKPNNEMYDDVWKDLWNKHCEEEYLTRYQAFCQSFNGDEKNFNKSDKSNENGKSEKFYFKSRYYSEESDLKKENEKIQEETIQYISLNESDELKLLGLPTSFGHNHKKLRKRNLQKQKNTTDNNITKSSDDNYFIAEEEEEEDISLKDQNPFISMDVEALVALTKNKTNKKKRKLTKRNMQEREIPKEIRKNKTLIKYWRKRFSLFSLFNYGIKLDEESWFSVTPEKIAINIAERLKCDIVIDAFCGCGGNTIQFARTCNQVIAIDIDPKKIEYAKHNAKIYGVENKIDFIVGDFLKIYENFKGDCIFLSPPWGGPKYLKSEKYDIEKNLQPVSASELFEICKSITDNIAIYLPKNSDYNQIVKLIGTKGKTVEIVENYLNDRIVALTAFYGNLVPVNK